MEKKKVLITVKRLRNEAKLTHRQMGDKIGLSKQAYARLENGYTESFDLKEITNIAKVFNMTAAELLQEATPEGEAKRLLKEGIVLFRQAQEKIDRAEQILNHLEGKQE